MSRFTKFTAVAAVAALASVGVIAAEGDAAVGTAAFTSLSVEGGAGVITATGTSVFGGELVTVSTDDTGDGTVPGADLAALHITQDPDSQNLTFAMELADGLPTTGSSPIGVYYEWHLGVAGGDAIALRANFSEYDSPGGFVFSVTTFSTDPTTGNGSFDSVAVPGSYDGTSLTWEVAPSAIGASAGDKISVGAEGVPRSGLGVAGFVTFPGVSYDEMSMGSFRVGGGARMVIMDAAGEVVDEATAKVRRGEFTVSVDDLAPGTYTVEMHAEYGDGGAVETHTVVVS